MSDQRTILVRYDEIGLKGRNRKYFEKILLKNIKRSLPKDKGIEYRVPRGRIMIDLSAAVADEYADRLKRKFQTATQALPAPVITNGGGPDLGVVSIGSCDVAVKEALQMLADEGIDLNYMRIRGFPFSDQVEEFLNSHERCVVIEQNRDAQLRSLLVLETNAAKETVSSILNYGGLPIDAGFVADSLRKIKEVDGYHELRNKT